MKRYNNRQPQMPIPRGPKATCSIACGNMDCRVNLHNIRKGERFTVAKIYGTDRCRGYRKP